MTASPQPSPWPLLGALLVVAVAWAVVKSVVRVILG